MSRIKEVLGICEENDLTLDQYVILTLIEDKPALVSFINKIQNSFGLLKGLHRKGYIKFMSADMDNYSRVDYIMLTPKGIEFTEHFVDETPIEYKPETAWIEEYRNIFGPAKTSGNRPIKGSKAGCSKKMERFLKEHPAITPDDIIKAASNYMIRMSKQNYKYVTCADYFIYKKKEDGEVSLLETELEMVKDGNIESHGDEFTVKL